MAIEVELPKEIDLTIKTSKELENLIRRRIEHEISKEIKDDIFLSMLFDDLLKDSELTDEDVDRIDHAVKKRIMKKLRWK